MKSPLAFLFAFCTLGISFDATFAQQLTAQILDGAPDNAPGPAYRQWTTFFHPRLGYELPVPPGVRALGDPERAAKTTFISSDGKFTMSAWGASSRQPASAVLDAQWKAATTWPGRTIYHQRKGKSWFAVSGTDETGAEFYQKFLIHGNLVAACSLTYPQAQMREFEPWVQEIENGFRFVAPPAEPPASLFRLAFGTPNPRRSDTLPRLSFGASRTRSDRFAKPSFSSQPPQESVPTGTVTPAGPESFMPASSLESSKRNETAELNPALTHANLTGGSNFQRNEGLGEPAPETQAKATPSDGKDLPVAEKVPGKTGFVYSPFTSAQSLVDVVDLPSGAKARCPYTKKVFRVP